MYYSKRIDIKYNISLFITTPHYIKHLYVRSWFHLDSDRCFLKCLNHILCAIKWKWAKNSHLQRRGLERCRKLQFKRESAFLYNHKWSHISIHRCKLLFLYPISCANFEYVSKCNFIPIQMFSNIQTHSEIDFDCQYLNV